MSDPNLSQLSKEYLKNKNMAETNRYQAYSGWGFVDPVTHLEKHLPICPKNPWDVKTTCFEAPAMLTHLNNAPCYKENSSKLLYWLLVEPPMWKILVKFGNPPQKWVKKTYLKPPPSLHLLRLIPTKTNNSMTPDKNKSNWIISRKEGVNMTLKPSPSIEICHPPKLSLKLNWLVVSTNPNNISQHANTSPNRDEKNTCLRPPPSQLFRRMEWGFPYFHHK